MSNNEVHCNGGFLDTIDWVNAELKKQDKNKIVIGFEKDSKNPKKIRFFDKNNRTVWLPDNFYKKVNIMMIKMGGLKVGRREYRRWKKIADGHCSSVNFMDNMRDKVKQITATIKKSLGLSK